ncbi:MAG: hypothetical protein NVS9B12_07090 [Vulcanimicrobiaceae bacterium]
MLKTVLLAFLLVGITGVPNAALRSAVVQAGGGSGHFDTLRLFRALAGPLAGAELAKLRFQFGPARVAAFVRVMNFTVVDSGEALAVPVPDPNNAKALATALVGQALTPDGTLGVDRLLDGLLSVREHGRIAADVKRRFGADADRSYHIVLLQVLNDLKRANHL